MVRGIHRLQLEMLKHLPVHVGASRALFFECVCVPKCHSSGQRHAFSSCFFLYPVCCHQVATATLQTVGVSASHAAPSFQQIHRKWKHFLVGSGVVIQQLIEIEQPVHPFHKKHSAVRRVEIWGLSPVSFFPFACSIVNVNHLDYECIQ